MLGLAEFCKQQKPSNARGMLRPMCRWTECAEMPQRDVDRWLTWHPLVLACWEYLSWLCHWKAILLSTRSSMRRCTTSRACTSMVQSVISFFALVWCELAVDDRDELCKLGHLLLILSLHSIQPSCASLLGEPLTKFWGSVCA